MSEMTNEEMEKMMRDIETPPDPAVVDREIAKTPPAMEKVKVGNETMLNRFIDPVAAKADVTVNPNDLDNAMMQHASLYIHYATQTVNARRQYDRLKNAFEILEARLDGEYREQFASEGKKVTEAVVKNAIIADKRWSGAQSKVIEAGSIWRMCEVVEEAMSQRKDMILEIARDRRKEKEGQIRVLENQDMRDRVLDMVSKAKAA